MAGAVEARCLHTVARYRKLDLSKHMTVVSADSAVPLRMCTSDNLGRACGRKI